MLGIGCPDRHLLAHVTSLKFALTVTRAPSRESGFVHGSNLLVPKREREGPDSAQVRQ
jgi:hypothetical protein